MIFDAVTNKLFNKVLSGIIAVGKAKNADTVNGFTVYKSLAELGLDEATATVESIVKAMADNSMLLHKLGGTATSAPIQFPYNYSTLRVTKLSSSYVVFECIGTGNLPIYYAYYNGGSSNKWSGWGTQCLPLTGGTLSGILAIHANDGGFRIKNTSADNCGSNFDGGTHQTRMRASNVYGDNNNRRILRLFDSVGASDVKNALRILDIVNGVNTDYTVLHTGNSNAIIFTEDADTAPSDANALWAHLD